MKKQINVFDYSKEIITSVQKGILITTKADKVNSMAISWGTLGIEWGLPIFTTFIRTGRFTAEQLSKNPEFCVNISTGEFDKKIIGICGSKSGRDIDKIKEANLTLVDSSIINVPAIKELPLTLECKVVYKQTQILSELPADIQQSCYPQNIPGSNPMANRDVHIAFYGQIVDSYIIE